MKVIVSDAVFAEPRYTPHLQVLFYFAYEGRHLLDVETEVAQAPAFTAWLAAQPPQQGQDYQTLLDLSQRELGQSASYSINVVATTGPDWSGRRPRLDPDTAVRFLLQPLCILVENKLNDGAFLLAIAHREHRAKLQRALDLRFASFQNGGGNTVLLSLLRDARRAQDLPRRLFALTDGDGLAPGQRSGACRKIVEECQAIEGKARRASALAYKDAIAHKVLDRRAIENYLPLDALELWLAQLSTQERRERRSTLNAYRVLTDPERWHYNLKEGFRKDDQRDDHAERGALYRALHQKPEEHQRLRAALDQGFGKQVAAEVLRSCQAADPQSPFQAHWIDAACRAELDPEIDRILALL